MPAAHEWHVSQTCQVYAKPFLGFAVWKTMPMAPRQQIWKQVWFSRKLTVCFGAWVCNLSSFPVTVSGKSMRALSHNRLQTVWGSYYSKNPFIMISQVDISNMFWYNPSVPTCRPSFMGADEKLAKLFNNNCHFWHNVVFHLENTKFQH